MILATIVVAIWITSYIITELLFGLYELWRRRHFLRRSLNALPGRNRMLGALRREIAFPLRFLGPGKA